MGTGFNDRFGKAVHLIDLMRQGIIARAKIYSVREVGQRAGMV